MPALNSLPPWAFALALTAAGLLTGWLLGHWLAQRGARREWRQRLQDWQQQNQREQTLWQEQYRQLRTDHQALQEQAQAWREALDSARDERALLQERCQRIDPLERQLQREQAATREAQDALARLQSDHAALSALHEEQGIQAAERLAFLEQARASLSQQFQQLASAILEEKSQRFTEQNQLNLGQLLDPLRQRLQEFQGRVEQFYDAEGKQRAALSQQVQDLLGLNRRLSDEANNLVQALKGSAKVQGNWGETLLERILEQSGLRPGQDYELQASYSLGQGRRAQPDVVLHLPQQRQLIIDAKVSLTAYERYVGLSQQSETSDTHRSALRHALRQHVDSLRTHIRQLSERNYHKLYEVSSLDFVVLFVPIEPAFLLALSEDERLSQEAWDRNVLLVAPSTLLFVLRTIAHLWRQEAQTRNAQEIARRGGELYDKLASFVTELEKLGTSLNGAQHAYQHAMHRLAGQKGNVIRQAELLRELGVQPTKNISQAVLELDQGTQETPAVTPSTKSDTHASPES